MTIHVKTWEVLLALALGCAACKSAGPSGSGGDGGSDAGGSEGGAQLSPGGVIPTSSGNALVDRLGRAAAACGALSDRTVPVGWSQSFNGSGCSIHAPPGFQVTGNQTQVVIFSSGELGAMIGAGVPAGVPQPKDCSPAGVAAGFLGVFESWGCKKPKLEWGADDAIQVVTDRYPIRHSVFSCAENSSGQPHVGYMLTAGTPSPAGCSLYIAAFSEPQASIETSTCTLVQIILSQKCPMGGGTDCSPGTQSEADCRDGCIKSGHQGGACTADGTCTCI